MRRRKQAVIENAKDKICPVCEKPKKLEFFVKKTKSKDGRGSYCEDCSRSYQRTVNVRKKLPEDVMATIRIKRGKPSKPLDLSTDDRSKFLDQLK